VQLKVLFLLHLVLSFDRCYCDGISLCSCILGRRKIPEQERK